MTGSGLSFGSMSLSHPKLGKSLQLTVIGLASRIAEAEGVTLEEAAVKVWERAERGEISVVDPDPPGDLSGLPVANL